MRHSDHILAAVAEIRACAKPVDLTDRRVFLRNLVLLHQVIVASEQLLEEARECATNSALCTYFAEHLDEEREHARWLAADLGSAGIDLSGEPRSRTAVAMAGSQYYLLKHVSPACLLGYMLVLECAPMPIPAVIELERLHGAELLRTVRYHAEHDPEHGAELLDIIDQHYCPEIMESAIETARYINEFAQELQ